MYLIQHQLIELSASTQLFRHEQMQSECCGHVAGGKRTVIGIVAFVFEHHGKVFCNKNTKIQNSEMSELQKIIHSLKFVFQNIHKCNNKHTGRASLQRTSKQVIVK